MNKAYFTHVLLGIALSNILLGSIPVAFAQTWMVTSSADSGPGTLREAIVEANANPGEDRITFDASLSGATIEISSAPLPESTEDLEINASDLAMPVTLQGPQEMSGWMNVYGLLCSGGTLKVTGLNTMGFQHGMGSTGQCDFMQVGDDTLERGAVHVDGAKMYGVYLQSNGNVVNTTAGEYAPNERGVYIENAIGATVGSTQPFGRVIGVNNTFNGINFFNSQNVRLVNAVAHDNGEMGIRFKTSSGILGGPNPGEEVYTYGNGLYGISFAYSAHDAVVDHVQIGVQEDGTLNGNHSAGISMDDTTRNVIVRNSIIRDHQEPTSDGMVIDYGAQNITIENNTFSENHSAVNVRAGDVSLIHNQIDATGKEGIQVGEVQGSIQNILIANNIITGANTAIQLADQNPNNTISNATIQDNQVIQARQSAISVQAGNHNVNIWGNTVEAAENGVDVRGSNVNMDATQDATKVNRVASQGMCLVAKGDHLTMKGNECMGSIVVTDGGRDNTFEQNEICPQQGLMPQILVNTGDRNTFQKNNVTCAFGGEDWRSMRLLDRPFEATSNAGLLAPVSTQVSAHNTVSGDALCAECTVDVYGQWSDRRVEWVGGMTSDAHGLFSFTSPALQGYENAFLTVTDAAGNTSPSTQPLLLETNTAPAADGVTAEQLRDGSRKVSLNIQNLVDAEQDNVDVWVEYSIDAGQSWQRASLEAPSQGTVGQAGQVMDVQTSSTGENLSLLWNVGADLGSVELANVQVHVAAMDAHDWSVQYASPLFQIDTQAPQRPTVIYPARTQEVRPLVRLTGGEPFTKVFTEGSDSGYRVDIFGRCQAHLLLPVRGPKQKILQLVDEFGNRSEPVKFTVTRY